jgi:hypothetical protein
MDPILYPVRALARLEKKSPTQFYKWIDEGEIESVLVGNRRQIVMASYRALVRRLLKQQNGAKLPSSNPKANGKTAAAAPAAPARKRRAAS